jgi:hypothetical protein
MSPEDLPLRRYRVIERAKASKQSLTLQVFDLAAVSKAEARALCMHDLPFVDAVAVHGEPSPEVWERLLQRRAQLL